MATQDDTSRRTSDEARVQNTTQSQTTPQTEVPPVLDNVPSTPGFIKYGAAILLGLAVGIATYVAFNGVPSSHKSVQATEQTTKNTTDTRVYEPMMAPAETHTGKVLQEAANAESVAPLTPVASTDAQE
ncbi:MAG: hypothetical protein K2M55_03425 [Muribaculaceae bacterium]|nr:hypothetical protein [Muribaculaceae bacterium]